MDDKKRPEDEDDIVPPGIPPEDTVPLDMRDEDPDEMEDTTLPSDDDEELL